MKIKKILYKYKSINQFTENLIVNGDLYFARFSEQNDPNEAVFDYSTEVPISVEEDEIPLYPNFSERVDLEDGRTLLTVSGRKAAEHIKRRVDSMNGILCLTSDPKNLLMFDYYSSGHKGICIGFDWEKFGLIYKNGNGLQIPKPITYGDTPPIIDVNDASNFDDILYTKWKKYKHEKEYRLRFGPGVYPSRNNVLLSIKKIIFGCAISEEDKSLVFSWVDQSALSVSFYQARLRDNSYQLQLDRIQS